MIDKRSRSQRWNAEAFKRWLFNTVESLQAIARAAAFRITDVDRDELTSSLATCDVQQLRYLCGKLDDTIHCLQVWRDRIGDALDRRIPYDESDVIEESVRSRAEEGSRWEIGWLDPWYPTEAAERAVLENELRREIVPGHDLCGVPFVVIGRRKDRDEVLLQLHDGTSRLAVVHRAGPAGHSETPPGPSATSYGDLDTWIREGLMRDHDEWWSEHSLEELDD